jgi:hypothetical protein
VNPGPPTNYTVAHSQLVEERFLELVQRATELGIRSLFLRAARYTYDELRYAPAQFGESREHLPHMELELRIAFAPPLYVEFAVHEQSRQVFIRRFGMLG